jgi:hypothetical protein
MTVHQIPLNTDLNVQSHNNKILCCYVLRRVLKVQAYNHDNI